MKTCNNVIRQLTKFKSNWTSTCTWSVFNSLDFSLSQMMICYTYWVRPKTPCEYKTTWTSALRVLRSLNLSTQVCWYQACIPNLKNMSTLLMQSIHSCLKKMPTKRKRNSVETDSVKIQKTTPSWSPEEEIQALRSGRLKSGCWKSRRRCATVSDTIFRKHLYNWLIFWMATQNLKLKRIGSLSGHSRLSWSLTRSDGHRMSREPSRQRLRQLLGICSSLRLKSCRSSLTWLEYPETKKQTWWHLGL